MLYALSKELENKILNEAKKVEENFGELIKFDEYITLPDYGAQAILRFGIMQNDIDDISKLDEIECKIRDILDDGYYGNLISETYQVFGFNRDVMVTGLKAIDKTVSDEIIKYKETSYSDQIKSDGKILRELLKLSAKQRIWEIQILTGQDVDALIIVVDTTEKTEGDIEKIKEELINLDGKMARVIYFKDDTNFNGCIKAEVISCLREKSMHHIIMDYANHNYII